MRTNRALSHMTVFELDSGLQAYFSINDSERVVDRFFKALKEETCSICLEEFTNNDFMHRRTMATRCMHLFHSRCFRDWSRRETSMPVCPYCIRNIDFEQDYRIWKLLRRAIKHHHEHRGLSDHELARMLQEQYNKEASILSSIDQQRPMSTAKDTLL